MPSASDGHEPQLSPHLPPGSPHYQGAAPALSVPRVEEKPPAPPCTAPGRVTAFGSSYGAGMFSPAPLLFPGCPGGNIPSLAASVSLSRETHVGHGCEMAPPRRLLLLFLILADRAESSEIWGSQGCCPADCGLLRSPGSV